MALTPQDNNEAFYREVDERLREDRFRHLWQNHGRTIIVAVMLLLVGIGAGLYWRNHRIQQAEARAEALSAVLDQVDAGKPADRAKLAPLEQASVEGYRLAASLLAADLAVQRGDTRAAVAGYGAVAADGSTTQAYRDLALIRQTAVEFDTLPAATVVLRMKPLAVAGSAWLGSAGEMLAAAYLKQNKQALAGPVFATMAADTRVPATLRSRATQMAGMLGASVAPIPATGGTTR